LALKYPISPPINVTAPYVSAKLSYWFGMKDMMVTEVTAAAVRLEKL